MPCYQAGFSPDILEGHDIFTSFVMPQAGPIYRNGRYASTQDRVINRHGADRYSIPYFVNPGADVVISAPDGRDSFSPFNYGDYQADK